MNAEQMRLVSGNLMNPKFHNMLQAIEDSGLSTAELMHCVLTADEMRDVIAAVTNVKTFTARLRVPAWRIFKRLVHRRLLARLDDLLTRLNAFDLELGGLILWEPQFSAADVRTIAECKRQTHGIFLRLAMEHPGECTPIMADAAQMATLSQSKLHALAEFKDRAGALAFARIAAIDPKRRQCRDGNRSN